MILVWINLELEEELENEMLDRLFFAGAKIDWTRFKLAKIKIESDSVEIEAIAKHLIVCDPEVSE